MNPLSLARQSYLADQVLAASPARLVTLLYDRLVLDLDRATSAQQQQDWSAAATHLGHAQRIVSELLSTLDTDAWDGAEQLHAIYVFCLSRLMAVGADRDLELTTSLRELLAPIRDAWREAAATLTTETGSHAAPNGSLGVA